ncbi:MAG: alpha/beta hydrolase [Deltaproteobacteria bacterium]|nr:alpha/beta hydrolase [Deltaproteobacteria bacterium]
MMKKNRFFCLGFFLVLMFCSPHLFAGLCTIDSNILDRGEKKAFIICGADIPSNYSIKGLSGTNITIEYEQYLKMCTIGIQDPGIYLILRAQDDAMTASISILNAETKETVCEGLTITVPDRVYIPECLLKEPSDPNFPFKILEIKANGNQDLSNACTEGLNFPNGKWPTLSLLKSGEIDEIPLASRTGYNLDEPLICKKSFIQALVKVKGQQRYPAKIIIPKIKLPGGKEKEGVAYVTLHPPVWSSSMSDEDAKYIDVNGIRTRYFEKGKGDALLLVHGGQAGDGSNSAQSWEQNYDYLSQYFHVYALDRLGKGHTDNPKKEEDYKEHYQQVVDHVYGFIKAVGIKKVHLIGHSQGGWPVTRIALDHPEMVKSLVNLDGSPAPPDPLARFAAFTMYMVFYLHPPEGPTPQSIRRGIELWSYSFNNITDKKVEQTYTLSYLPKMIEATKLMTKHGVHPGSPPFLALQGKALEEIKEGKLKVPTLLIWGYHDSMMHHEVGIELFKCIINSDAPGSRLIIFDNCDHFPFIEYPELFNRTIKSFCGAYTFKSVD